MSGSDIVDNVLEFSRRRSGRYVELRLQIEKWLELTDGWFHIHDLDKDLKITLKRDKECRKKILYRMVQAGQLEKHKSRYGVFRKVQDEVEEIDWRSADPDSFLDIRWPFGLEKLVRIYSGNIIIIAGSPNAGKSAFLLNFIDLNQRNWPIHYFSSEMGAEELKLRLSKFGYGDNHWDFKAYSRASDFARVIRPDDINLIDYLEVADNFYLIAQELREIHDRLQKGIAVIALQKKRGAQLGRGAEFSLEKPRLYLSMDQGELEIVKAKNWALAGVNPNGMKFKFKLVDGCKFIIQEDEEVPF